MVVVEKKAVKTSFGTWNWYVKTDKCYYYFQNCCAGSKRISKKEYDSIIDGSEDL